MFELIKTLYEILSKESFASAEKKLRALGFIPAKETSLSKTSLVDIFHSEYEINFPEYPDKKRYLTGSFHFGVKDVPSHCFLFFGEDYFDKKTKMFDSAHLVVLVREMTEAESAELRRAFGTDREITLK